MTVGRLTRELSANELREWQAFSRIVPFMDEMDGRANVRAAQVCSTLANVNRGRKQAAYRLKDFILCWEKQKMSGVLMKAKSVKVLKAKCMALLPGRTTAPNRDIQDVQDRNGRTERR